MKKYYNKKARFDYEISDTFEAGIVLTGLEIKSIRVGKMNLTGSHVKIIGGELFWLGGIIQVAEGDQQRSRKLLMHKSEINKLMGKSEERGQSIVPISLYIKRGKAKLNIGLGRGRKKHDKREMIKKRDFERRELSQSK